MTDAMTLQKTLIVYYQALSGTDPLNPPSYDPTLSDDGLTLNIKEPLDPVLTSAMTLVHEDNAWMSEERLYEADKFSRLAGLGTAVEDLKNFAGHNSVCALKAIPLAHECSDVIGNYSITNFPVRSNSENQKYYPVIVEFKLKLVNQSVDRKHYIKSSVRKDIDSNTSHSAKKSRVHDPSGI